MTTKDAPASPNTRLVGVALTVVSLLAAVALALRGEDALGPATRDAWHYDAMGALVPAAAGLVLTIGHGHKRGGLRLLVGIELAALAAHFFAIDAYGGAFCIGPPLLLVALALGVSGVRRLRAPA